MFFGCHNNEIKQLPDDSLSSWGHVRDTRKVFIGRRLSMQHEATKSIRTPDVRTLFQ